MISVGIVALVKMARIKDWCRRVCERTGWTDYDPNSPALKYFFTAMVVIGGGWLIAAVVNR